MKLPIEVRLEIYELVFQDTISDMSCFKTPKEEEKLKKSEVRLASRYKTKLCRRTFAMFHVNYAMRTEGLGVCYRLLMASIHSIEFDERFRPSACGRVQKFRKTQGHRSGRQARTKEEDRVLMHLYTLRVQR